jgi:hypothetical protein
MALNGGHLLGRERPQGVGLQLRYVGTLNAIEARLQVVVAFYLGATIETGSDMLSALRLDQGGIDGIRRKVVLARMF